MEERVIDVQENQKLYRVIENIPFDRETLYLVHIDKQLINQEDLVEVNEHMYKVDVDGYEIILSEHPDSTYEWFWLSSIKKPDGKYHLLIVFDQFYDFANGHCGFKEKYIRKCGSKAKIGEE